MVSSYTGQLLEDSVHRFDHKKKGRVPVTHPFVIQEYNKFMGGVDLLGSHLGRNKINMTSRKWYMRMWHHIIDIGVVNRWILYKQKADRKRFSIGMFRQELAFCLMKSGGTIRSPRGRSPWSVGPKQSVRSIIPPTDVRKDQINHFPIFDLKRGKCKIENCKGIMFVKCQKCDIHLCFTKKKHCFNSFHM